MAIYTHKDATLDTIDGHGYAFAMPDSLNDDYRGVFFSEEDEVGDLKSLVEGARVEFSGIAYRKTRAGQVRSQSKTFLVDVKNVVLVSAGVRADFEVLQEVEDEQ